MQASQAASYTKLHMQRSHARFHAHNRLPCGDKPQQDIDWATHHSLRFRYYIVKPIWHRPTTRRRHIGRCEMGL